MRACGSDTGAGTAGGPGRGHAGAAVTRQPRTLADWLQALEASGWKGRKAGREWCGPCPRCGGVDRFHVGPGARVAVVAGCRHGCTFEALAETLFGARTVRRGARCRRVAGGTVGRRAERGPTRPKTRPKGENASGGDSRGFGGGGPPKRPTSGGPAENEAVESPLTHDRAPPRGRGAPAIGPDRAAALWSRSGPVPPRVRAPGQAVGCTSPPMAQGSRMARGRPMAPPPGRR